MAVFKTNIPEDINDMIKQAAKDSFMSRQKYIEKLIHDDAENQARIMLRSKKCRTRCGAKDLKTAAQLQQENKGEI
jgi:hypothetical protein